MSTTAPLAGRASDATHSDPSFSSTKSMVGTLNGDSGRSPDLLPWTDADPDVRTLIDDAGPVTVAALPSPPSHRLGWRFEHGSAGVRHVRKACRQSLDTSRGSGHLAHGEKLAYRPRGLVACREAVQQGSSTILARACMDLHILAFLVRHTSRICTGWHVLARI
jgi:hypothetical protein